VDVDAFLELLTPHGQALLGELTPYDEASALAVGKRLRRDHSPELVATAMTQARLRSRAHAKFGGLADRMYFTPDGLEQATRTSVAVLRAKRFHRAGVRRVADLCCGIGGDAIALAQEGMDVLAVDRDSLTCAVATANAVSLGLDDRIKVRCDDVTTTSLDGCDAVFLDPARRSRGRRTFDPDAYSPPWSFVGDLMRRLDNVCAKVAPGIPHDLVPDGVEAEWVSDYGDVKEAALWSGRLSTGVRRRATLLPSQATLSEERTDPPEVRPPGRFLYEPDGAVIRAHLVAEVATRVGGSLLDPTIAFVTSDRLVETPFATAYEVTDVLPFQLKRLRAALRARDAGALTVKKRGSAIEPETLRRQLRLDGTHPTTIVVTRVAGAQTVLIVEPASPVE
jgi:SAM-dependent methyltransferase